MEINKSLNGLKGIYKLIFNNYTYVGSSKNIFRRLKQHKYQLMHNRHSNIYMQRIWNKYKPDFTFQILEICSDSITHKELLKLEHQYIISEKSNLNLKLDPETETRCLTTIKAVYQFDLFGNFIKKWESLADIAEYYKINSSNLTKVCSGNQQSCAGFLWSYHQEYTGPILGIYVYNLQGILINTCNSTIDIYEKYFSNKSRKTVLSQLQAKIDSNSPYCNLYLSHSKNFKIPNKDFWYKENNINKIFQSNPWIIKLDELGNILTKKRFLEYKGSRLKKDIIKNPNKYTITDDAITFTYISHKIQKLVAIKDNEELYFSSLSDLIKKLFNKDKTLKSAILHHIARNTPFRGWIINRDC